MQQLIPLRTALISLTAVEHFSKETINNIKGDHCNILDRTINCRKGVKFD